MENSYDLILNIKEPYRAKCVGQRVVARRGYNGHRVQIVSVDKDQFPNLGKEPGEKGDSNPRIYLVGHGCAQGFSGITVPASRS